MIEEDYVSFETAKLLKEKRFPQEYDIYHSMVYNEEDYEDEYEIQRMVLQTQHVKAGTLSSYPVGVLGPKCYCCTIQMAMKWLREIHHLHIWVGHNIRKTPLPYYYEIHNTKTGKKVTKIGGIECGTYELACEAAIKYCLENLI